MAWGTADVAAGRGVGVVYSISIDCLDEGQGERLNVDSASQSKGCDETR